MGYRNYIGYFPKKEYNKIKSLTPPILYEYYNINPDEDSYIDIDNFATEIYELGKYCEFDYPKKSIKPFFKKKETQSIFSSDHDLYVVEKEFLANIISTYKERIKSYYNNMVNPFLDNKEFLNSITRDYDINNENKLIEGYSFDFTKITVEQQTAMYNMINHVKSMRLEWSHLDGFDLNDGTDEITSSWKYEYAIFELVRIYKTFDWKKNVMVYYGS